MLMSRIAVPWHKCNVVGSFYSLFTPLIKRLGRRRKLIYRRLLLCLPALRQTSCSVPSLFKYSFLKQFFHLIKTLPRLFADINGLYNPAFNACEVTAVNFSNRNDFF